MKNIYIIDASAFIYRNFFAVPEFTTSEGKVVNAIFGMANFFIKFLAQDPPDYIFYIKDARGKNFRHELYADYKATRDRMPDSLVSQLEDIDKMVRLMGMKALEISGYEADDVIATVSNTLKKDKNNKISILSGDKDLYYLIDDNVSIYDTQKKKIFSFAQAKEKFGVEVNQILDYLALVGDKSDNVPGVAGFGPKKVVALLEKYDNLANILNTAKKIKEENIKDDILKGKTLDKMIEGEEIAILSRKLVDLKFNVDIGGIDLDKHIYDFDKIFNENVQDFFRQLEFNSLVKIEEKELTTFDDINLKVNIIKDKNSLKKLEEKIKKEEVVVFDTETTSIDPVQAKLLGISIYFGGKEGFYIDCKQLDVKNINTFINKLLENKNKLIAHNLKYDLIVLKKNLNKHFNYQNKSNQMQIF